MNNPQYSVVLSPVPGKPNLTGELSVICETSQDSSVNVKLIRARGERVTESVFPSLLRARWLMRTTCSALRSETFSQARRNTTTDSIHCTEKGCEVSSFPIGDERPLIRPSAADSYTLVVSTFRPGDEGSFELIISSNLPVQVVPIVQEGGGMFSRTAKGSW